MAEIQPAQSSAHIEYSAVGDYSGTTRRLEPRRAEHEAAYDAESMTLADRVWVEQRSVTVGPWEAVSS